MVAFTKGKWFVHTMDPTVVIIPGGGFDINAIPDAEANAHLIAAAPDMYKMIMSLSNELYMAIDEINGQRLSRANCQTESQPDLWDMESLHDAEVLLAKARGE